MEADLGSLMERPCLGRTGIQIVILGDGERSWAVGAVPTPMAGTRFFRCLCLRGTEAAVGRPGWVNGLVFERSEG